MANGLDQACGEFPRAFFFEAEDPDKLAATTAFVAANRRIGLRCDEKVCWRIILDGRLHLEVETDAVAKQLDGRVLRQDPE